MPFTKQPEINTYQTKQIPLLKELNSRASGFSKDIDYLNIILETTKNRASKENEYTVWTRPGLVNFSAALQSTNIRAVYFWESQQKYFVWIDDDIQIISASTGAVLSTVTAALSTSSGPVGVTEFVYDTGAVKLVFSDGTDICTIDSAYTVVTGADVDWPTNFSSSIVFLDGYIFFIDTDTGDICNSDLNDPLAYTTGGVIGADIQPDLPSTLSKLNNYLVVFGTSSIEYFWDSAEAAPSSPLTRNDTPVKYNGYLGGKVEHGNKIFFVGNVTEGAPGIFVLEDWKIKEISNESIRRQIESATSFSAGVVETNGHAFYVLTAGSYTYVFDMENMLPVRWAQAGSTSMPITFALNSSITGGYKAVVALSGYNKLAYFDPTTCQDFGTSPTMSFVTHRLEFDSYNHKSMNRLSIVGDRPSTDTTVTITWSDDDYQTFNSGQTVNLNQELPCIYRLGRFRRRAIKLSCAPTVPFRIEYLEADLNLGVA